MKNEEEEKREQRLESGQGRNKNERDDMRTGNMKKKLFFDNIDLLINFRDPHIEGPNS